MTATETAASTSTGEKSTRHISPRPVEGAPVPAPLPVGAGGAGAGTVPSQSVPAPNNKTQRQEQ